ncbi:TPA: helix-turn-helix domain-containing protein [Serratia marcescens]
MNNLGIAIKGVGIPEVAKACGVSERAVYKWIKNGRLPRTEFFGKTAYAEIIQNMSAGKYHATDLLNISRQRLLAN